MSRACGCAVMPAMGKLKQSAVPGVIARLHGQETMGEMDQNSTSWWQNGIFYQVYPRSFQDFNADGVGDIAGIAARLPYLSELGVDAVWLSPVFPSPMADFG